MAAAAGMREFVEELSARDPATVMHRHPLRDWWAEHVVSTVDHGAVIDKVHEDAGWSAHFAFMTFMSAGIAILGLLLSSPAVVIGAMLISPLMGPIIGFGFGLALFDFADIRRSLAALAIGVVGAVLFCAIIVGLSPLQTVTTEIAARTRPNLFDLLVALFSGLAGTYAMIRGRHGTIVGVAIATALMPPLAVTGYGLATFNFTVFGGAALLFLTNLVTIALSAAMLARLYGFGHTLSPRQTGLQAMLLTATFIALAIPLGLALRQIAWEAVAASSSTEVIEAQFPPLARISEISFDYDSHPIAVTATVLTPTYQPDAEAETERMLSASLGRAVQVNIEQFRVGTASGEAEASQLAAARGGGAAERNAARVAERLALVAGVSPDRVLIDQRASRAVVRAGDLPGASLASYRALEARVAQAEPRWRIELIPPALPLPDVTFDGEAPDTQGQAALELAVWAARRLNLPIAVTGDDAAEVETVLEALSAAGVRAEERSEGDTPIEGVRLRWTAPSPATPQPQE